MIRKTLLVSAALFAGLPAFGINPKSPIHIANQTESTVTFGIEGTHNREIMNGQTQIQISRKDYESICSLSEQANWTIVGPMGNQPITDTDKLMNIAANLAHRVWPDLTWDSALLKFAFLYIFTEEVLQLKDSGIALTGNTKK
jgi:hypothetical protein